MKQLKSIFALVFVISCAMGSQKAFAQNEIQIALSLAPPYSPYFSDYLVYENKTTLVITGPNALQRKFYLRGTITGDNGISITTHTSFKPAVPLQFNGSPTLVLKGIDIEEYFKWDNVNVTGTDLQKLAQGDGLPEGNYTICLRAYDYTSNEPLSQDAPGGCVTISIRNIEPPIINLPRCGANVVPNPAQTVVFSWNPPPGAPPATRYLLKIAELPTGFTNYNDALNTLTTPAFFEKEISTSSYAYTLADAPLTVGKTYAFKVVAFDITNKTNFRNRGESEVCYFTYGGENEVEEITKKEEKKKSKPISTKYTGKIPTTTIKGKLQWAFHKEEETDNNTINNTFPEPKQGKGFKNYGEFVVNEDVTFAAAQYAAVSSAVQAPSTPTSATSGSYIQYNSVSHAATSVFYVTKTEQEKKEGKIETMVGKKIFPYKNVNVKIYLNTRLYSETQAMSSSSGNSAAGSHKGKVANVSYTGDAVNSAFVSGNATAAYVYSSGATSSSGNRKNEPDALGRILLGVATTDENGEFEISALGYNTWKVDNPIYSIEFSHPSMIFATRFIENTKPVNDVIDLGTHTGLARTFKARIKVKTPDIDSIQKGEPLNDATFKILRRKNIYNQSPYLQKEVNGFNDNTATEGQYEVVGTGKAGALLKRFFYTGNSYADRYYLVTESTGYTNDTLVMEATDSFTDFNVSADEYLKGFEIITNEYKRELKAPTSIDGIVVTKENNVPLPKVKVVLVDVSNDKDEAATITDEAGKFSLDNLTPNPRKTFKLKISDPDFGDIFPSSKDGNDNPEGIIISSYGTGGSKHFNPLYISAGLTTVKGIVKDDEGKIITGALLKWKEGGNSFESGADNGEFITAMVPGEHSLIITAPGYRETIKKIIVDKPAKTTTKADTKITQKTATSSSPSVNVQELWAKKVSGTVPTTQYAANLGYSNVSQLYTALFGDNANLNTVTIQDVGDVIIKRFYVKVTVVDAKTKAVINKAIVQAEGVSTKAAETKADGTVVIDDAPGKSPTIVVKGPANSLYIAQKIVFDVTANNDTVLLPPVELKEGTALTGKVLLAGNGVKDANVFVDGMDYLKTTADASGNYTLALPDGTYKVKASKKGLKGDNKEFTLNGTAISHNFNLTDPGFEADKLLGFDIELYESKDGSSANQKIISGAFVNIPNNSIFQLPANYKLPFNNITINIDGGKPTPLNDEVTTTVSELPFQIFDYLSLKLKSNGGIKVKKQNDDGSVGKITGIGLLDVTALLKKVIKLSIPDGYEVGLRGGGSDKKEVTAFVSNGALPLNTDNLKLAGINEGTGGFKMFDAEITVDYNNSYILKDGIQFGGSIKFNGYPVIGNKTFGINQFKINKAGDIKFDVACNVNEEIGFSSWKLKLGQVNVNNFGVKLSGGMSVDLPQTDKVTLSFSNLAIAKDGISGGQFQLYSKLIADALKPYENSIAVAQEAYNIAVSKSVTINDGTVTNALTTLNNAKNEWDIKYTNLLTTGKNEIKLFNILTYEPVKEAPFSLAKETGTNDYKLQGGGVFGLAKYFKNKITLNYFAISTGGKFAFSTPLNVKMDFFDVAEMELTKFEYNGFDKYFGVGGKVYLKLPSFGLGAGTTIKYYQNGAVDINEMSFRMAVGPIGELEGSMAIKDKGFAGSAKLKILKAFDIGTKFVYEKINSGFRFGLDFSIGPPAPMIPIGGPFVKLTVNGGGFEINTANPSFMIKALGSLELSADPASMLGIKPLEVKFTASTDGPILEGTGKMQAVGIALGDAGFKIDYPNRYLTAYANTEIGLDLIPGLPFKSEGGFRVSASMRKGNEYFMLGMFSNMEILSLLRNKVNIAFAWGMPKTQGTDEDKYVEFIPDEYLVNGKVFGFNFLSDCEIGIPKERAIGFDIGIASFKAWYYNKTKGSFYSNFYNRRVGFGFETNFQAGAEVSALEVLNFGLGVDIGGYVNGGFDGREWAFNAGLGAGISINLGDCDKTGCNGVDACWWGPIPTGLRVCARGSADIHYSSSRGLSGGIRF
jgi:hypothetical protein